MSSARSTRGAWGLVALLLLPACGREAKPEPSPPVAVSAPAAPVDPGDAGHPTIVVLGDSLTAGLGLPEMQSYPAVLQEKVNAGGYGWDVINAGVSGDTSAAGLERLDWALGQKNVRILVLELG